MANVHGTKGMNSVGTGDKEPTDINKLADEYFRLSYHGIRSKDNDFNADIKTRLMKQLATSTVPQDIGRVLLNLLQQCVLCGERKVKSCNCQLQNRRCLLQRKESMARLK